MAKLRKFAAYRQLERPYTRKSKYSERSFIRATPVCKVIRFDMGNKSGVYHHAVHLVMNDNIQIRHNALEAARLTANRYLEKKFGKLGFYLKLLKYPHHYLRENPLASGAGADRMSTGMKCSFGKVIGMAAQVHKGDKLFTCFVDEKNVADAKIALKKSSKKIPCGASIVYEKLEKAQGLNLAPVEGKKKVKDVKEEPSSVEQEVVAEAVTA